MKELTIEEKAKAYDEAKIRISKAYNDNRCTIGFMNEIFPELKESEESEDDRIRKGLISMCQTLGKEEWVAWIEKQGERELVNFDEAEKEKSDFVGDGFIECHADFLDFKEGNTYWLEYMGDDKYNVRSDNLLGKTYHITPCQLYTVFKKLTWLEKQGKQDNNEDSNILQRFSFYSYKDEPNILYLAGLYVNDEYRNKGIGTKILEVADEVAKSLNCYSIRLKTKKDSNAERLYRTYGYNKLATEERDEIWLEKQDEQKFTEVKPKFNVGNIIRHKEQGFTCKITGINIDTAEYEVSECSGIHLPFDFQDAYELVEQNPIECSEDNLPEFESYLCLMFQKFRIKYSTEGICTNGEIIDYVMEHSQKLKDTLCHAWSEEDELNLSEALHHIRMYNLADKADKLDKWLKSLKTRVQPQQQWSEEDERQYRATIAICNSLGHTDTANWLKSHRPQPTWKPNKAR